MRKIKTKGLKIKVKHVDRGPRFAVALHSTNTPDKAKDALLDMDLKETQAIHVTLEGGTVAQLP